MAALFERCNDAYFGGELPVPTFEVMHSTRKFGYFSYNKEGYPDPVLSMSDAYDGSEKALKDIMCHEMIHYYLAYTGADRNCRHGRKFKRMAKELNLNYGLNISVKIDTSLFKRNKHSHFWQSKQRSQAPIQQYNTGMRFYKEYDGVMYEFNSIKEYLQFIAGRIVGLILFVVILIALCYFFNWYGETH